MCFSSLAEKALIANPRWAALIGAPHASAFHSSEVAQEVPHSGVNYPDTDRKFPAISMPVQASGKEYLHHVPIILPQTSDALVAHPPSDEEGLCYIRCKSFRTPATNAANTTPEFL